ncbi:homolog of fucose/glucose/galactose permeases [Vibrio maritimus]|uniref:Homolog of fucose/glucose/galactose permeases n=1 Tax=Vibrio maritimus TaxID=990268 RepID=A0A090S0Q5_9VIBR|nr:homolog of fucose/glucose/galactose permeases [Vibrio maritimus]
MIAAQPQTHSSSTRSALWIISLVPLIWGALTAMTSLLVPYLRDVYSLSHTQSVLVQVVFSLIPVVMGLPSAFMIGRYGYRSSLFLSLALALFGCGVMLVSAITSSYVLSLAATIVISIAVTTMQVVVNPVVTNMGPQNLSSQRLTFSSMVNAIGVMLAPLLAAGFLFRDYPQTVSERAANMLVPYLGLVLVIVVTTYLLKQASITFPNNRDSKKTDTGARAKIKHPHFWFGVVAIFCYTGAEVSVATYLISYLSDVVNMAASEASRYIAFYWGGALLGRIVGAMTLARFDARNVLISNASVALFISIFAVVNPCYLSGMLLVGLGLCHSIMYPVIFSLALNRLGAQAAKASGILVMAGCGGAIFPMLQALLADRYVISDTFGLVAICYLIIMMFSVMVKRLSAREQ